MEVKRSDVCFVPASVMTAWVHAALSSKDYYALADWPTAGVLKTDTGEESCKVSDLIDDAVGVTKTD